MGLRPDLINNAEYNARTTLRIFRQKNYDNGTRCSVQYHMGHYRLMR
jgi:hypothetical protein